MKIHSLKNLRKYLLFSLLVIFSITITIQFNTGLKTLSLETLDRLEDVAYAAQVASVEERRYVELHAYYKVVESVIYNVWKANYPELAYIVVIPVLVTEITDFNGQTTEKREIIASSALANFYKVTLEIANLKEIPKELPFELINITADGYYGEGSWKELFPRGEFAGYYYARHIKPTLVNGLKLYTTEWTYDQTKPYNVINGTNAPNNSQVEILLDKGVNVIALKSWSYSAANPDIKFNLWLSFRVSGVPPETISKIHIPNKSIKVNIDRVRTVRQDEKLYEQDPDELYKLVPRPGHYSGHPGDWVVYEEYLENGERQPRPVDVMRPYTVIEEILTDVQVKAVETGKPPVYPPGGNGLDWLEVAATNIYGPPMTIDVHAEVWGGAVKNRNVTNCVWWVMITKLLKEDIPGYVSPDLPYLVSLNLSFANTYEARFNQEGTLNHGFYTKHKRDAMIVDLCLHSYRYMLGKDVDDKDRLPFTLSTLGDEIYVKAQEDAQDKSLDAQNKYFWFAFDNRKRGFLWPNRETKLINGKKTYLYNIFERWTSKARVGDRVPHDNYRGYFLTKIEPEPSPDDPDFFKDAVYNYFCDPRNPRNDFGWLFGVFDNIPDDFPCMLRDSGDSVESESLVDYKPFQAFLYKPGKRAVRIDDLSFIKVEQGPGSGRDGRHYYISGKYGKYCPLNSVFLFKGYTGTSPSKKEFCAKLKEGYSLYVITQLNYFNGKNNKWRLDLPPDEFDASFFGAVKHDPRIEE